MINEIEDQNSTDLDATILMVDCSWSNFTCGQKPQNARTNPNNGSHGYTHHNAKLHKPKHSKISYKHNAIFNNG